MKICLTHLFLLMLLFFNIKCKQSNSQASAFLMNFYKLYKYLENISMPQKSSFSLNRGKNFEVDSSLTSLSFPWLKILLPHQISTREAQRYSFSKSQEGSFLYTQKLKCNEKPKLTKFPFANYVILHKCVKYECVKFDPRKDAPKEAQRKIIELSHRGIYSNTEKCNI